MKALQKDPQQRFENVLMFAQAFAQTAQSVMQLQQYPTMTQNPSLPASPAVSTTWPAQFMQREQWQMGGTPNPMGGTPNPTGERLLRPDGQSWQDLPNTTTARQTPSPLQGSPNATAVSASAMDLRPASFASPSQSVISTAPNNNLYPPPPPLTPSMPSHSTLIPAQAQWAGPALQPPPLNQRPPEQRSRPSMISRRSLIGGGIAGLVIAGGLGAWLYIRHATGGALPTIPIPTGNGSIPGLGPQADKPLLTYSGHKTMVMCIAWSPDGTYIASGAYTGDCHVWTANDATLLFAAHTTLQPPISDDFIQSIVWSRHNPPRIAVGFVDGTLQILDVTNRKRLTSLDNGYKTYGVLSWSPDEKYLAVCKPISENAVDIYEVATWNIVFTYTDHTDSLRAVAWSPDGNYVASGSDDTTIRIWNPTNGQTHLIYKEHTDAIEAICWSNDSTKLLSTAQDYVVRIWEQDTGTTLSKHQYPSRAPMGRVVWSHNNQLVAAYPGTGSVDILDTQLTVKQTIQTGVVFDLSWSPDDTRLATANYDNTAQVWSVNA